MLERKNRSEPGVLPYDMHHALAEAGQPAGNQRLHLDAGVVAILDGRAVEPGHWKIADPVQDRRDPGVVDWG
jgi:hypothetical protein